MSSSPNLPDQQPIQVCSNCGAVYHQGPRCPNCGYTVVSQGAYTASLLLMIFVGVPSLLVGGCFGVMGMFGNDWGSLIIGLVGAAVFGLMVWLVVHLGRRRR